MKNLKVYNQWHSYTCCPWKEKGNTILKNLGKTNPEPGDISILEPCCILQSVGQNIVSYFLCGKQSLKLVVSIDLFFSHFVRFRTLEYIRSS